MANIRGNISTYDQSTPILEDLSSAVRFGAAYDAPLYAFLDRKPATDKDHKWIEDKANTRSTTANNGGTVTSAATSMTVSDGSLFAEGDVIVVDSEYLRVSSVSSNTLTVSRAFGGTTADSHTSNATVVILTNAQPENAGPEALATAKSEAHNYTQIFIRPVDVSRTMQRVRSVTGSELEYQIMKSALEVALDIERALLRGKMDAGSDSGARAMQGLDDFITTETDDEGGTLSINEFNTFLRGIWDNGGSPDILLCDGLFLSVIHEWNVGSLQVAPSDRIGGVRVTQWVSPFGVFTILPDRQVATGTCYALTSSACALAVLDDVHYQELARTSDGISGQVVAEVTLECANEQFHGRQYGVTGSA
ncbi:MAG TPA: DUF5309 family protein [Planctomycetota bacterium]|nr:DUF5309 family protein [Planctomycetota bacterium]